MAKIQAHTLDEIKETLDDIRKALIPKPAVSGRILWNGKVITMPYQLQDTKTVAATFQFVDADGFPTDAPPGLVPQWLSSDPTKATVSAAPDGMSAVVAGQASLGDTQISVSVPGTTPLINASDIVTVVPGPPVGGKIVFGTPTP